MRNITKALATMAVAAVAAAALAPEAMAFKKERTAVQSYEFPITFRQGGKVQTGSIYYRLFVQLDMHQRGRAPQGRRIVDDRSCRWAVMPFVDREVCFETVLNRKSCHNALSYRLPYDLIARHTRGNILEYKPCQHFLPTVDDIVTGVSDRIVKDREAILRRDLTEMRRLLPRTQVEIHYGKGRLVYPKPRDGQGLERATVPNMSYEPVKESAVTRDAESGVEKAATEKADRPLLPAHLLTPRLTRTDLALR